MPSGRTIVHGLWQSLRPSSNTLPQKSFHAILWPDVKSLIGCRKLQQRQTHIQSSHTRPRIGLWLLRQLVNLQPQQSAHRQSFFDGQSVREQARIKDLDITSAYQELRKLKRNYAQIQDLVKALVKDRGQKPNLRLYDALLLANTDNQYGSAGEVARILDEIAVEGLTPDSATYHAALRVRYRASGVRYP